MNIHLTQVQSDTADIIFSLHTFLPSPPNGGYSNCIPLKMSNGPEATVVLLDQAGNWQATSLCFEQDVDIILDVAFDQS